MTNQAARADRRTAPDPCQVRNCAYCRSSRIFGPLSFRRRLPIHDGHSSTSSPGALICHHFWSPATSHPSLSWRHSSTSRPRSHQGIHNVPRSSTVDASGVATALHDRFCRPKIRKHSSRRQEIHMEGHSGKMGTGSRRPVLVQHKPNVRRRIALYVTPSPPFSGDTVASEPRGH